jgi:hypothetical protein
MTAAQKTAKLKFKQAIAYRQKTGVTLKEAFAHIYGKKVGVVKKKAAPKKKVGALPVGFKGSIYKIPFKIVNQYDIYNDVSALMEDTDNGNRIVAFDGKGNAKDKAQVIVTYIDKITQGKYFYKDDKQLFSRMLKFATNMQKEVKDFNAGKKKTIKKAPLKILAPKNIITTKKRLPSVIKLINKSINKVYKQSKKKAPKKVAKRKLSNIAIDRQRQALPAGKRISKSGKVYYENRENRMDRGKLLGIVKAKPTVIALSKKIARQTDLNEHNLAILSLAKFLKAKKAIELMNNVIKMHDNYGYMPKNLIDIRDEIFNKIMILLKSKYGEIDYNTIKNSF